MTRIHAGAQLERLPGPKYAAALGFAEISLGRPLPNPKTLQKWADDMPDGVELSFVVPYAARTSEKGDLRFDEAMEDAVEYTIEAASILKAKFVVLPTGAGVTTGPRHRERLRDWFSRWEGTEHTMVWHPTGLWDPEIAQPFAAELGVVCGFDPLISTPPAASTLYCRLRAIGARQRFDETLLLEIADSLEESGAEDAYVALESPKSFREASRLATIAS